MCISSLSASGGQCVQTERENKAESEVQFDRLNINFAKKLKQ